jgi:hypothetical protein
LYTKSSSGALAKGAKHVFSSGMTKELGTSRGSRFSAWAKAGEPQDEADTRLRLNSKARRSVDAVW